MVCRVHTWQPRELKTQFIFRLNLLSLLFRARTEQEYQNYVKMVNFWSTSMKMFRPSMKHSKMEQEHQVSQIIVDSLISLIERRDMSPHSDTLSWFRDNQSFLFLLNAVCLDQGSNQRSTALEASTLTITSPMAMRIIRECWHFNHMWTTLTQLYHFT
jgi:hypothetical protein